MLPFIVTEIFHRFEPLLPVALTELLTKHRCVGPKCEIVCLVSRWLAVRRAVIGFGSRLYMASRAILGGVQGIVPMWRVGCKVRNSAVPAFVKPGITLFAGRAVDYKWGCISWAADPRGVWGR
jgi:hypothetical protein